MSILDELRWRGLLADCTDETELATRLASGPIVLYAGFDPTADSLHVGSMVPLLGLRRFQRFGHHPVALAGGATGSIGDPSGKTQERSLLTRDQLDANLAAMRPQLARLLDFETTINPARLVDNADWTAGVTYLDFLRDVGKHFTVNQMVAKESVRARMEDREHGISYTEFSYMLLQAFDFAHLCQALSCELQIGGTDQWGNITLGLDLIRKKLGRQAYGLVLPLITKADGTKFGKTEAGTIWLDARRTSVYRFYQFWINTDDRDVIRYLKFFTFLTRAEVEALEQEHQTNPGARAPHRALAKAVTDLVHGEPATQEAIRASEILFGGALAGVSENTFTEIIGEVPTKFIKRALLEPEATGDGRTADSAASGHQPASGIQHPAPGLPLLDLLIQTGLSPSKGHARKDVEGCGIYVNNVREASPQRAITPADLLFDKHLLLRKGKKNYVVVTAA